MNVRLGRRPLPSATRPSATARPCRKESSIRNPSTSITAAAQALKDIILALLQEQGHRLPSGAVRLREGHAGPCRVPQFACYDSLSAPAWPWKGRPRVFRPAMTFLSPIQEPNLRARPPIGPVFFQESRRPFSGFPENVRSTRTRLLRPSGWGYEKFAEVGKPPTGGFRRPRCRRALPSLGTRSQGPSAPPKTA